MTIGDPPQEISTGGEEGTDCEFFTSPEATEVNVPQHTKNGIMDKFRNQSPVGGPVEVLIVTYSKDLPWLEYCLKCIKKYLHGFQGVTVAYPNQERDLFALLRPKFDIRLHGYDEVSGKGFLQHELKMAEADLFLPNATRYVMHLDSDCMYHKPTTPEDYFFNNKPQYLWRTWESLISSDPRDPTQKVVSDCMMWKGPTEAQLGYHSDAYCMTRHPTIFPIEFYPRYRAHIEKTHNISFFDYMLSGQKNTHPQDRMDFTAMGQYARSFMRDDFHWINVASEEYPADRQKAFHSHSGLSREIRTEIESFLK